MRQWSGGKNKKRTAEAALEKMWGVVLRTTTGVAGTPTAALMVLSGIGPLVFRLLIHINE